MRSLPLISLAAVFGVITGCAVEAPLPDPNPSDAQLRLEVAGNHAIYSRERSAGRCGSHRGARTAISTSWSAN